MKPYRRLGKPLQKPTRTPVRIRLTWPHGSEHKDHIDLKAASEAGYCAPVFVAGVWHLRFAAPFDDLSLADGEVLTFDKVARLGAAFKSFGAVVRRSPSGKEVD